MSTSLILPFICAAITNNSDKRHKHCLERKMHLRFYSPCKAKRCLHIFHIIQAYNLYIKQVNITHICPTISAMPVYSYKHHQHCGQQQYVGSRRHSPTKAVEHVPWILAAIPAFLAGHLRGQRSYFTRISTINPGAMKFGCLASHTRSFFTFFFVVVLCLDIKCVVN